MRIATSFSALLIVFFSITLLSAICARNEIPTEFNIWEFPFDTRILAAGVYMLLELRKNLDGSFLKQSGLGQWHWKQNIFVFFVPALVIISTIVLGLMLNKIEFQGVDNVSTYLLSTMFDIPVIFFFSVTTLFVEELFFRGYLLKMLSAGRKPVTGGLIAAVLWSVFRLGDILGADSYSLTSFIVNLSYLLSTGLLLSMLFHATESVWSCYIYRIGTSIFSSMLLSHPENVANSLFYANSVLFSETGVFVTALNLTFAYFLTKVPKTNRYS